MQDLSPRERDVLHRGLLQWGGPVWISDASAARIGYQSQADIIDRCTDLAAELEHEEGIHPWSRSCAPCSGR